MLVDHGYIGKPIHIYYLSSMNNILKIWKPPIKFDNDELNTYIFSLPPQLIIGKTRCDTHLSNYEKLIF